MNTSFLYLFNRAAIFGLEPTAKPPDGNSVSALARSTTEIVLERRPCSYLNEQCQSVFLSVILPVFLFRSHRAQQAVHRAQQAVHLPNLYIFGIGGF